MALRPRLKKAARAVLLGLAGAFVVIQLWPYGREHTNPGVIAEPSWDRDATRELAQRACFDCHSNETHWPWYSSIAPFSWYLQNHVDEGREILNFSEWNRPYEEAGESAETVVEGSMPPWDYALMHAKARLSQREKDALVRGLTATFGTSSEEDEHEEGSKDAD